MAKDKLKQTTVPYEIERRWLLKEVPKELIKISKITSPKIRTKIKQWYISINPVIRVRSHNDKIFVLCIKTKGKKKKLGRPELEINISKSEFKNLIKLSSTLPLHKTRYLFPVWHHVKSPIALGKFAELDIFHEDLEGLIFIELEFHNESEARKFKAPAWFGKEVTGIRKYSNSSLAKSITPF